MAELPAPHVLSSVLDKSAQERLASKASFRLTLLMLDHPYGTLLVVFLILLTIWYIHRNPSENKWA
jgi:hypothetical protein